MQDPAAHRRELLDKLHRGEIDADQLAMLSPDCGCEAAAPVAGGFGQVRAGERLRYFLTARSDVDIYREPARAKSRPFRAANLGEAFKRGLSVCRLGHATKEELERTARIIYEQRRKVAGKWGGILAVVDFPVEAVRVAPDPRVRMCVLDTPMDQMERGWFARPSHADIVQSRANLSHEERIKYRTDIYNQIITVMQKTNSEDVKDCDLLPFIPKGLPGKTA